MLPSNFQFRQYISLAIKNCQCLATFSFYLFFIKDILVVGGTSTIFWEMRELFSLKKNKKNAYDNSPMNLKLVGLGYHDVHKTQFHRPSWAGQGDSRVVFKYSLNWPYVITWCWNSISSTKGLQFNPKDSIS
jgi:hypothetical protein